jgi:hypothetical protein
MKATILFAFTAVLILGAAEASVLAQTPTIDGLHDVALNQGGSAVLPITIVDQDTPIDQIALSIASDNYVLLPTTNITMNGAGAARTLTIVPAPNFSGSSRVIVTVSDGQNASATAFDVTVSSLAGVNPLLALAEPRIVSTQQVRLRFADAGTGTTNYLVETRTNFNSGVWIPVTANVAPLGNGVFEAAVGSEIGDTVFYRVRGAIRPTANFDSQSISLGEGNSTAAVIVLSQPFSGTIRYTVSGSAGSNDYVALSGTVNVNGTTVAIPIQLLDDNVVGPVRSLTLTLSADGAYIVGNGGSFTLSVDDNDSAWSGTLQGVNGNIGIWVELKRAAGQLQGTALGNGLLPADTPLQVSLTANSFVAVADNVTTPAANTLFNSPLTLKLTMDAQNGVANQLVSADEIDGRMTLTVLNEQMPALSFTNQGTFVLFKTPPKPSTNEVILTVVQ